jgi:hypothetical protein
MAAANQNQPDHRAAIGQKRWHEVFIGGCGQSSKRKISKSGIQGPILEWKTIAPIFRLLNSGF